MAMASPTRRRATLSTRWWAALPERWPVALLDRWPTVLAIGSFVLIADAESSPTVVAALGELLVLLPLVYLVSAKLERRSAAWPAAIIGGAYVVGLRTLGLIQPATVLTGLALCVLVWALLDGHLTRSGVFQLQVLGMVGFGFLALAGPLIDTDLGRFVVAAGWLLHGVWDLVHLKLGRVVSRSYAECCGVLDILIAAQLVFL